LSRVMPDGLTQVLETFWFVRYLGQPFQGGFRDPKDQVDLNPC
jgi:hypothetical protein